MFYFLDSKPTFLCRKHTYTLVAAINLDRAYLVALYVLIVGDGEPFIGKVILSFLPVPLFVGILSLFSL